MAHPRQLGLSRCSERQGGREGGRGGGGGRHQWGRHQCGSQLERARRECAPLPRPRLSPLAALLPEQWRALTGRSHLSNPPLPLTLPHLTPTPTHLSHAHHSAHTPYAYPTLSPPTTTPYHHPPTTAPYHHPPTTAPYHRPLPPPLPPPPTTALTTAPTTTPTTALTTAPYHRHSGPSNPLRVRDVSRVAVRHALASGESRRRSEECDRWVGGGGGAAAAVRMRA